VMTSAFFTSAWASALINHLWQSTAVALLGWMLTVALRSNSARVRYAIWLSASIKFLVPFQLLTYVGSRWSTPIGAGNGQVYSFVEEFTRSLRQAPIAQFHSATSSSTLDSAALLWSLTGAIWLCGFAVLLSRWIAGWKSASQVAAAAEPITQGRKFAALEAARASAKLAAPIRLLLSSAGMEPGIFGIVRPVLVWPAGLSERLDDVQIAAIMAHEVEHVRRHDNLTSAIHSFRRSDLLVSSSGQVDEHSNRR
jgi:bla regulator protein BlaR1